MIPFHCFSTEIYHSIVGMTMDDCLSGQSLDSLIVITFTWSLARTYGGRFKTRGLKKMS